MRYLILVLLNLPVIFLALINILTQYKLRKVSRGRFRHQIIAWVTILVVLIGSFPLYNYAIDRPLFDASSLSAFDIVETTAIIFLFYVVNNQRQHIERTERLARDLHQELSIRLSEDKYRIKK